MILLCPDERMIETNIKTKKQKDMPLLQSEKSVPILIMILGFLS